MYMNQDLVRYYARRASEYERIYKKPERQPDISRVVKWLKAELANRDILEVACGTGYWTQYISETASSILVTDINPEVIEIAKLKHYPGQNVSFAIADIYSLPTFSKSFNAVFGGFIWSHILLQDMDNFLDQLNYRAGKNGKVVFIDNIYVDGSSHLITSRDDYGNTYQERQLLDGTKHKVLKNFPSRVYIYSKLEGKASNLELFHFQYYWLLTYEIK